MLRLLLGHAGSDASPVPPRRVQDILIVTYTRAATEELRGRIRKRLRAAREAFETGVAPDDDAVIATLLAASNDRPGTPNGCGSRRWSSTSRASSRSTASPAAC